MLVKCILAKKMNHDFCVRFDFNATRAVRLALAASLSSALMACGGPQSSAGTAVQTREPATSKESGPGIARPLPEAQRATGGAQITLGPMTTGSAPNPQGRPLQVGVAREIVQTRSGADLRAVLKWATLPSGSRVATITYNSSGAKGLRLGLLVNQLPTQALLRFYGPNLPMAHEVPATEILALLQLNKASGDTSTQARTYWSPTVAGDKVTLEIHLPTGVLPEQLDVGIGQLSHLF
jgi:lysyl endopeptidase